MAIEIYDKGKVIRKDGKLYFLIKHGSKNSFTLPNQRVVGDNLFNKFLRKETRDSDWEIIATGTSQEGILDSLYNCPTSSVYGKIRFGNKKNMACYLAKVKVDEYSELLDEQRINFNRLFPMFSDSKGDERGIDLDNLKDNQKMKEKVEYCGKTFELKDNFKIMFGRKCWNLDNL